MPGRRYGILANRIKRGSFDGFIYKEGNSIETVGSANEHMFALNAIDGVEKDSMWGRFFMKLEKSPNVVCNVYVYAGNEKCIYYDSKKIDIEEFFHDKSKSIFDKRRFIKNTGWQSFIGVNDILLYGVSGRYLFLVVEIVGDGTAVISDMTVMSSYEDFLDFFPEVYRDRNSFFHRFLAIFGSIYHDFEKDYRSVKDIFDLDKTPTVLLPVLAEWMGLDLSGNILDEHTTRTLVKNAYSLNRMKGTRTVIEIVTQIILGEKPTIVENNILRDNEKSGILKDEISKYYGNSRYDVTVMIHKNIDDEKKIQYSFILNQFIPIRCRLHIVYLKDRSVLDEYTYLDVNAEIYEKGEAVLDNKVGIDNYIALEE